ncbi:MAG: MFS transporter [Planctomycetota bacterium]|jgi:MFS family permease
MAKLPFVLRFLIRDARTRTRIIYAWELPSIMRKHIVTGAMGTVYFVLVSGMYLVAFGNNLGMQYWQWGVLGAVSSSVLVLQLLSAYWVRRTGYRRSIWFYAAIAARLVRGAAILAAFVLFDVSSSLARLVFVLLLVAANCFDAITVPPWYSWLADIIPGDEHGRFWGRRSAWIALANLCVVVPIGYLVDRFGGGSSMPTLMAVFAFGFVLGVLDLFFHRTIPEPRMKRPPRRPFWKELRVPLRDREFRPWLVFNGLWTFGMTLGGSLATIYFVEDLGIRGNFFGGSLVLILLPLAGTILLGRWLGALVDRHGVKHMLRWGHAFWAFLPLFWVLATPATALFWLGLAALVGGVSSGAAHTAANKLVVRLRSSEHVPMYTAVSACIGCLAGAVGPLLGGFLLQALRDFAWTIGGFKLVGFHVLFIASFVLRNCATLAIGRIREPGQNALPG